MLDPELLATIEAEKDKTARRLAEIFTGVIGPLSDGLQVVRGEVVEELIQGSHTADLVVMGRNRLATGNRSDWLSDITRLVLKRSWAPILLPGSKPSTLLHGPFLLAYDASLAANRTLRQLARLAALTKAAMTVLSVGPPETTGPWLEEARSYCKPYNLELSLEAPGRQGHGQLFRPLVKKGNSLSSAWAPTAILSSGIWFWAPRRKRCSTTCPRAS